VFLGHLAVGFGAKRAAPSVSLGTLFFFAQLADFIWPTLVLLGVERVEIKPGITPVTPLDFVSYPYSHSLLMLAAWALMLGVAYRMIRRTGWPPPTVLFGTAVSHWVLDVISHRPDMPIALEGDPRIGLGLWNSVAATVIVEGFLFAAGVIVYAKTTTPRDRIGRTGLWILVGFLVVIYLLNLFGPPPPSSTAVAWGSQAMWLIVLWGWWVDRHRDVARFRRKVQEA
jgi:hypothetical protein